VQRAIARSPTFDLKRRVVAELRRKTFLLFIVHKSQVAIKIFATKLKF